MGLFHKSKVLVESAAGINASSSESHESSTNKKRQHQKRNQISICDLLGVKTLSPLFKLTEDCVNEIFEYLSLKELHAFGRTCKIFQKISGEYFKQNFKSADHFVGQKGIFTLYSDHRGIMNQRTNTTGFNQYINCILLDNDKKEPLSYLQSHSNEFSSINQIRFSGFSLDRAPYLRKMLAKIETIEMKRALIRKDFYGDFLQFCPNLKRIEMQEYFVEIHNKKQNLWLQRKYPLLEHFVLTPEWTFKIKELNSFLERNPNIRYFATHSKCLWENKGDFLKSKAKLETLEIRIYRFKNNWSIMQKDCNLLNELFKRGFFKCLRIAIDQLDQRRCDFLCSLIGLEALCIDFLNECYSLPMLTNLKELAIRYDASSNEIEILAMAKSLVRLERLYLANATYETILPFIRQSKQLREIMFFPKNQNELGGQSIDLVMLNKEREKLVDAKKVIIFVPDNILLETKWTIQNGQIDLELVEMRRSTSIEWKYGI